MRTFRKILKINMLEEMHYKMAFVSGIICQFAFGFLYIILYNAFFESGIPQKFDIYQTSSYLWLQQAFFAIFCYSDANRFKITNKILNGDVCYQLLKPINLYDYWLYENISRSASMASLRCLPIIMVSLLLPSTYKLSLPISLGAFLLFLISLLLGLVLISEIKMFAYIAILYTLDAKGVFALVVSVCTLLSGGVIPVPLMPEVLQKILNFMPFRYASDLPFRIYIGDFSINEGLIQMGIQILWIVLLFIFGRLALNHKSKKLVVQGG